MQTINSLRKIAGKVKRKLGLNTPVPFTKKPQMINGEFSLETLPWLDSPKANIKKYVQSLNLSLEKAKELEEQLSFFQKNGYLILRNAISHEQIDKYLNDVQRLFIDGKKLNTLITDVDLGNFPLKDRSPDTLNLSTVRVCDFHNNSSIGKDIMLAKPIVEFLKHYFGMQVVAMQSLTFLKGSQQDWHQDFAYVVSEIPSHLAAAWIALEDVDMDAGPLRYYPGSHRIKKFDFGNGPFLTPESIYREGDFARYLEKESENNGLKEEFFAPKKGDVLIWHGALVHSGSIVKNPELTRKSYVVHYSSSQAYTRDRRNVEALPRKYEQNGAVVYGHPNFPDEENFF